MKLTLPNAAPIPLPAVDALPALTALAQAGGVLAMITAVDGRFFRRVGAMMAFLPGGTSVGQLSGGCIEADLALHAAKLRDPGQMHVLRYGRGSPFADLHLPCGSGITVTLRTVTAQEARAPLNDLTARQAAQLALPGMPCVRIAPVPRVMVFGLGAEVDFFTRLARAADYDVQQPPRPDLAQIDAFTAVALFFHDHDREIEILATALQSPAFWIGALGSHTAHQTRLNALRTRADVQAADLPRIRGPIGLIPNARDPQTLAISVLADITAELDPKALAPQGRHRIGGWGKQRGPT